MLRGTMVGGAENIELRIDIDCDLDDDALYPFLIDAHLCLTTQRAHARIT